MSSWSWWEILEGLGYKSHQNWKEKSLGVLVTVLTRLSIGRQRRGRWSKLGATVKESAQNFLFQLENPAASKFSTATWDANLMCLSATLISTGWRINSLRWKMLPWMHFKEWLLCLWRKCRTCEYWANSWSLLRIIQNQFNKGYYLLIPFTYSFVWQMWLRTYYVTCIGDTNTDTAGRVHALVELTL